MSLKSRSTLADAGDAGLCPYMPPSPPSCISLLAFCDRVHRLPMHARLDRRAVRLLTRTGLDWTRKYPAIARGHRITPGPAGLSEVLQIGVRGARGFRPDSKTFVDDSGSVRGPFRTRIGRNLGFLYLGRPLLRCGLKLLKIPLFLPSAGLGAGEFTIYKKSASTA
jgi:hypothetical protein